MSLVDEWQCAIVLAVAEHLLCVAFVVCDLDVCDVAVFVSLGCVYGVDESLVGSDVECLVAVEDFLVQLRVDLDGIAFYEGLCGLEVAC